tara:strand:+ start:17603 stop:17920 length:318 start_codon:yes stop_codon:yes gene_type:complete
VKTSFNGNLILKPWGGSKELETKQINRGLAGVNNKVSITALELLVDSFVILGYDSKRHLPKGTKVYFKDSVLHVQKWSKEIYYSEELPEGFVVGDFSQAVLIEEK